MYILKTEKRDLIRIRRGWDQQAWEQVVGVLPSDYYVGQILPVVKGRWIDVHVGDSYLSLSRSFGIPQSVLRQANHNADLYPTRRLFVPQTEDNIR